MRIIIITICFFACCIQAFSQTHIVDITHKRSADRAVVINLLHKKIKPQIKQDITFIVTSLFLKNNFAFFKGNVKDGLGQEIDFKKTFFKSRVEAGIFDGDYVYALFKKVNGKWKYLIHAVGPTDIVYACWAYLYKAPKELFDVNDNCGN